MKKLRRLRYKLFLSPFKGNVAYEVQILNLVIQWRHIGKWSEQTKSNPVFHVVGPLNIWIDPAWRI